MLRLLEVKEWLGIASDPTLWSQFQSNKYVEVDKALNNFHIKGFDQPNPCLPMTVTANEREYDLPTHSVLLITWISSPEAAVPKTPWILLGAHPAQVRILAVINTKAWISPLIEVSWIRKAVKHFVHPTLSTETLLISEQTTHGSDSNKQWTISAVDHERPGIVSVHTSTNIDVYSSSQSMLTVITMLALLPNLTAYDGDSLHYLARILLGGIPDDLTGIDALVVATHGLPNLVNTYVTNRQNTCIK